MNTRYIAMAVAILAGPVFTAKPADVLRQVQTIELPGVEGRMDHLAIDLQTQRLFVAALGNNTLEVVDLESGKRVRQITGLKEPQGVVYLPEMDRLIVTNGEGASATVLDGRSLQPVAAIPLAPDPDNLRYDPAVRLVYVGHGKAESSAIGIIDPGKNALIGSIKLEGHPESFQLETQGRRIFVNVPTAHHIAVLDRDKAAVVARWPIKASGENFPMALDEAHHRLFIGCRKPAKILVLDTDSGKTVVEMETVSDTDDLFYDGRTRRLYVSGGEGAIAIFRQDDADRYTLLKKHATASGARTCLFVPTANALYLAVPHRGSQQAELRVYDTDPVSGSKPSAAREMKVYDFENLGAGKAPREFTVARTGEGTPGRWEVQRADATSGKQVVTQLSDDRTDHRFPLLILDDFSSRDVDVSVRFKTISGKEDAAGGLIWRCQDKDNYYVIRANALEDNVVAYKTVNGKRSSIGIKGDRTAYGVKMKVPHKQWNTLRVIAKGNSFTIYFNGQKAFEVEDDTFSNTGKVGLWTKADAVTQFDDLMVARLAPPQ